MTVAPPELLNIEDPSCGGWVWRVRYPGEAKFARTTATCPGGIPETFHVRSLELPNEATFLCAGAGCLVRPSWRPFEGRAEMWCETTTLLSEPLESSRVEIEVPEPGPGFALFVGIACLVLLARVFADRERR
jgi:hypothetical protein